MYIGSCAGVFYALNVRTGALHWKFDAAKDGATQFHGNPLVWRDRIIVGTDRSARGRKGFIYCLDRMTGTLLWKRSANPGVPSDVRGGDSCVFAVTLGDSLLCVNALTGDTKWSFGSAWHHDSASLPGLIRALPGLVSSPVVIGNAVYFAGRDSVVYALDARTGDSLWARKIPKQISTEPLAADSLVILGTSDSSMVCLDFRTGAMTAEWRVNTVPMKAMSYLNGQILFLGGTQDRQPREVGALDLKTGLVQWKLTIPDADSTAHWYVPRLHVWKGQIIAGSASGLIVAYDVSSGVLLWQHQLTGRIRGIGSSMDILFVGNYDGILFALTMR